MGKPITWPHISSVNVSLHVKIMIKEKNKLLNVFISYNPFVCKIQWPTVVMNMERQVIILASHSTFSQTFKRYPAKCTFYMYFHCFCFKS